MQRVEAMSAGMLRRELSARNRRRGVTIPHEATYGGVPSVVFQEHAGGHGNFLEASYWEILARPDWAARLAKSYSADCRVPRRWDRKRRELDCANSSDALLMNIFCYPEIAQHWPLCALLGVERGLSPVFGYKPQLPVGVGRKGSELVDRTEADMLLGTLLVEAKLTETSFQSAPMARMQRYAGFETIFDMDELAVNGGLIQHNQIQHYQLVRGVLAANYSGRSFAVLCDARRVDLIEKWFRVMRAVRGCELRSRLAIVTWQEIAATLPAALQEFLDEKYGIVA